jgi:hypothetical protein
MIHILALMLLIDISSPSPTVGVESTVQIDLPGTLLEAKPVTDKAPLLVRIATTQPAATASMIHYDLRYIGLVPGRHDLKNYLVRADASSTADLPEISVTVTSILPPNHQGELMDAMKPSWPFFGGYRIVMGAAVVLWLALLFPLIFAGRKKKDIAAEAPPAPPPTFADRLRPLIDQANRGTLSTDEKGRLERMLLWYWRERLELSQSSPGDAIAELRRHPQAGELLRALEQWLHRPPGRTTPESDIAALLEPYRNVPDPVISEPALAAGASAA